MIGRGDVPILTFLRTTMPTRSIETAFSSAGLPPPRLFPNSSLAAVLQLAVDGIGIAVIPRAVAEPQIA